MATISRVCTKDYKFHNTAVTVEKGTFVLIPALGLHHDPEYWPNSKKWDPDRFSEENKDNIRPFTYLPFGEGPRNCIGERNFWINKSTKKIDKIVKRVLEVTKIYVFLRRNHTMKFFVL